MDFFAEEEDAKEVQDEEKGARKGHDHESLGRIDKGEEREHDAGIEVITSRAPFGGDELRALGPDDKVGENGGKAEKEKEDRHEDIHVGEVEGERFLDHERDVGAGVPLTGSENDEDAERADDERIQKYSDDA